MDEKTDVCSRIILYVLAPTYTHFNMVGGTAKSIRRDFRPFLSQDRGLLNLKNHQIRKICSNLKELDHHLKWKLAV